MLNIHPVALEIIRDLQPTIGAVRKHDRNLADQLDRSATSVALDIAEGDAHRGAMRRSKHEIALGEAREVCACLDIAEAKGVPPRPRSIEAKLTRSPQRANGTSSHTRAATSASKCLAFVVTTVASSASA